MTSTRVLLLAWLVCAATFAGTRAQWSNSEDSEPAASQTCTTPQGEPGECVLLQECDHLFQMFRQSRTLEARQRLRQFACPSSARYPRLCCANNDVDDKTPRITPRPITRPTPGPTPRPTPRPTHAPTPRPTARPLPTMMSQVIDPASSGGSLLQHRNINLLPVDECGEDFKRRIYGGNQTGLDEFPWAALLEYEKDGKRSFQCGGVLISKRYVLTAAHCSSQGTNRMFQLVGVRLGEYDINKNPDCETDEVCKLNSGNCPDVCADEPINFTIDEEIVHPDYRGTSRNQHNDIALLRLNADAPTNTGYIRPICIPTDDALVRKSYTGTNLTATGWGRSESGTKSPVKLKAVLPAVSNDECATLYARSRRNVTSFQMCAGGVEGVDVCGGDSGGPLMNAENVQNVVRYHVSGIVSYGSSFCHHGTPGVYTRVAAYSKWILDQLRP